MSMSHTTRKTALVTGASSGMGKVIAQQLLDDGLSVVVAARRTERMQDLVTSGAVAVELDVSNEESLIAAVDYIEKTLGNVDTLVNNAGFGLYGAVEDIPLDEARYQFEVNLFGLARLTQLLLPAMREQRSGRIVNISSMGGRMYTPLGAWYHASKHALEGFSDCLRLELAPFGIDVIIVEPGIIQTAFGDVVSGPMERFSGSGAYSTMAARVAEGTAKAYGKRGGASSPQLIANVVSKAVTARRPRTRYVAGKYASLMIFIRKWFGDRIFDRIVLSMVK
ncbi:oxidoreductase [Granulosicoccus sp. 3-233]|uniref:oxidoreductase n=1 Tax=Granulosicoccus sp. 3-233 TaxID=3417969 RepID=UPI003D349E2D